MVSKAEHTKSSEIGKPVSNIKELQSNPIMVPISDYLNGSIIFEKEDEREVSNLSKANEKLVPLVESGIFDESRIAIVYKDVISLWERLAWIYKKNVSLANKEIANIKQVVEKYYITRELHDKKILLLEEELAKVRLQLKESKKSKVEVKSPAGRPPTKAQQKANLKESEEEDKEEEERLRRLIE